MVAQEDYTLDYTERQTGTIDESEVDFRTLSRSVDVELTLQDVVNDGLAQVIHHMTVTVLKSQSGKEKGRGLRPVNTKNDNYNDYYISVHTKRQ